jgi:hypothetical protein
MSFGTLLRKYLRWSDRKILLESVILWLSIDRTQKNLFLESLELLDESGLESLYLKITKFVDVTEDENSIRKGLLAKKKYTEIEELENSEKKKAQNSFNILLDSI